MTTKLVNGRRVECTEADLTAIQADAARYLANASKRAEDAINSRRKSEYGTIGDQLDMLYWDKVNGTELWKAHIALVKSNNPKA